MRTVVSCLKVVWLLVLESRLEKVHAFVGSARGVHYRGKSARCGCEWKRVMINVLISSEMDKSLHAVTHWPSVSLSLSLCLMRGRAVRLCGVVRTNHVGVRVEGRLPAGAVLLTFFAGWLGAYGPLSRRYVHLVKPWRRSTPHQRSLRIFTWCYTLKYKGAIKGSLKNLSGVLKRIIYFLHFYSLGNFFVKQVLYGTTQAGNEPFRFVHSRVIRVTKRKLILLVHSYNKKAS